MRIFALVSLLFIGILVFGAGGSAVHAQTTDKASKTQSTAKQKKVTIERGDTLVSIARKYNSKYKRIFYANKNIKDPDIIYPGQKIRIPSSHEKLKKRSLPKPVANTQYQAQVSSPVAYSKPTTPYKPAYTSNGSVWDRIAQCESGGNWSTNTGNGYYGGLQFTASSWHAVGGSGLPSQASKTEQVARAKILQSRQGWGAWPACTSSLSIR